MKVALVFTDKPMKLESQFRMTYAMILKNLQHNKEADVTVENMITRSFKEFPEQAKHIQYRSVSTTSVLVGQLTSAL